MPAQRIIIDCDPGQDDAVALFLAMASPQELPVLGITAVAGNVPLELTQRNVRLMCDIAGRGDIPVFAGCDRPMVRELLTAEKVHGKTGIDGIEIVEPETPLAEQHAVDFIVETLRAAEDESVTLVPTGPLTNIGTVIDRAPDVLPKIRQLVIMGGAMREGGNYSPSAEFNILVDPHAADIVFRCGRPITSMGLDVTHQVLSTRARVER
ncbi:MAG TPA: nucleoside hydrolase, partial [Woeseiaceae bacterium]|nr:nucleoside hydrolase [Woeseiaceae bacterium]